MSYRLSKLKNIIAQRNLDAILVSSASNITYLTGFSGFSATEREAFLLITHDKQYILTDARYSTSVKNHIANRKSIRDRYSFADPVKLIEISPKTALERALKYLAKKHKIKKLGIEEDNLTIKEHKSLLKHYDDTYHYSIESLRAIKNQEEINAIEKACKLTDKTFKYILGKIKEGISEKELAFEIEFFIKKYGANLSFPPIIAFDKNSAYPHHKTSDQRLTTKYKIILLDFGVKLNNYCSDMTRTVFFGSAKAEFKKIYQTVLEAQQKAIEYLATHLEGDRLNPPAGGGSHSSFEVNSIRARNVDKVARDYIASKGYLTIPHGLGHGIGLEVHESPRLSPKSKDVLKTGMVFTIEPGIYIQGFGGVRIEDVVFLEKTGPRLLTHSPKRFIEL